MSNSTIRHTKPKSYLQQINVIQNCKSHLAFTVDVDQTGGTLGLLNDGLSNTLTFEHLASGVRNIPVSVNSSLTLSQGYTLAGACPITGEETVRMITTLTEFVDGSFYYYGGTIGGDWKINKFEKGNVVNKTSAMQTNNPAVTDLATAWASRASLTYGVL